MSDREHYVRTAGLLAATPIIVKVVIALFMIAAGIAIALGKISVVIGGGGLAGFILFAIVSSIVKQRRLHRAMLESDRD